MQTFNTQFTLSRSYLAECYDQSLAHGKNAKPNYVLPALMCAVGAGLLYFSGESRLVGSILIAWSVLELIHIRFRRAWWLARQMWGKSADTEVKLTINNDGIQTQNPYTQTALLWSDVVRVIDTDLGLILVAKSGRQQYLSKSLFNEDLIAEIKAVNEV